MSRESQSVWLIGAVAVGAIIALAWGLWLPFPEAQPSCPDGTCPYETQRCKDGICKPPGGVKPADPSKPAVKLPVWFPQVDVNVDVKRVDTLSPQAAKVLRLRGQAPGETPVVDLPEAMRTKNYKGGSCVHASTINCFKWHGLDEMAEWWRQNHGYGEYAERLARKMDEQGLKFAYVTNGDPAFIEWAMRTRRCCGIGYKPSHAINLVGLTKTHAILLDNNATHRYEYVPREEFFRRWKGFGGWAWALVYDPPAPRPRR
jgi:hypothetical protein